MKKAALLIVLIAITINSCYAVVGCTGRFANPITDVCWKCLFPITIAGFKVVSSSMSDTNAPEDLICFCPRTEIPVGFWEPVRLVDVTKSPMCMVSLGGFDTSTQKGMKDDSDGSAFYHIYWYVYPVIYWLEILLDFVYLEMVSVDIAYLTEFAFMGRR
ncbi:traU family protein [Orientia chuto str. Dubai]|uniref:TraU family protein n=1 Tax=Orientia chuto str. Dubai TaxID=1359168 RepID=A0A0F3MGR2_9RICK|nr:traU family protein [Orientia chuto str. Dubai]